MLSLRSHFWRRDAAIVALRNESPRRWDDACSSLTGTSNFDCSAVILGTCLAHVLVLNIPPLVVRRRSDSPEGGRCTPRTCYAHHSRWCRYVGSVEFSRLTSVFAKEVHNLAVVLTGSCPDRWHCLRRLPALPDLLQPRRHSSNAR